MDIALGLDVDGVLADFSSFYLDKLGLDPALNKTWDVDRSYGEAAAKQVYKLASDPVTIVSLKPLPGAVEAISLFRQAGLYPVFITSMPVRLQALRKWWLQQHFGEQLGDCPVYLECVPSSTLKPQVAEEYGLTHFVEDKRETANAMAAAGFTSILVPTSYHADGQIDPRVQVKTLLDFATEVASRRKVAA